MTLRKYIYLVILLILPVQLHADGAASLTQVLKSGGKKFVQEAQAGGGNSTEIFVRYTALIAKQLKSSGEKALADAITRQWQNPKQLVLDKEALAWLVHTFALEFYADDIITATSKLIGFKTFATDLPNQENPEFIRQKQFLKELANKLGLNFRDLDGYIQEIWIGDGPESFGLMVHSDVQPVDAGSWHVDPWAGEVKDDELWGRGAIDDKGPLAAIMYGMRAILDSGLPVQNKLILLVGTDEESTNKDVTAYLESNPAPDQTIVVDFAYPVYCAEKGWCGLWLKLPRMETQPGGPGYLITDLQSGISLSIVPSEATAKLQVTGTQPEIAREELEKQIAAFEANRTGADLELNEKDGEFIITAHGKSVHSSVPEEGHNALMDLLVFLDQEVKPAQNAIGLMTKFAATNIGFELEGQSLGIAYEDEFMGKVSVSANRFETDADSVMFMFNYRIPKGITKTETSDILDEKVAQFSEQHNVRFGQKSYVSAPLYRDPEGKLVQSLLKIYDEITGKEGKPMSTGGGTYAKRIPNSVVFGPQPAGEVYKGHQPNESISLAALYQNIELLTHTMVVFSQQK